MSNNTKKKTPSAKLTVNKNGGVGVTLEEKSCIVAALSNLHTAQRSMTHRFGKRKNNAERQFLKFIRDDIECIQDLLERCK